MEGVLGIWSAANTRGGLSLAGGQVALTREYLVFSPWDLDQTRRWLRTLLSTTSASDFAKTIDDLITKSKLLEPVMIPVADITSIEVLNRASWFGPPTARIHLRGGRDFDLGILASATTPNKSDANNQAFDDWLSRMPPALRS
jgi:hypothetical protein